MRWEGHLKFMLLVAVYGTGDQAILGIVTFAYLLKKGKENLAYHIELHCGVD